MYKSNLRMAKKRGIWHRLDERGRCSRYSPWLGGWLAPLYDRVMRTRVFPKTFGADFERHTEILRDLMGQFHGRRAIELGTGSGASAGVLPPDNVYRGIDISVGLLRRAVKRLAEAGFADAELCVADAGDLPFADGGFDLALCHLSLNFFPDGAAAVAEAHRVLAPGGELFVSVPVPERKPERGVIRGTLRSQDELRELFETGGFSMEPLPHENGAVLYVWAVRR